MSGLQDRHRLSLVLLALGAYAQIAQAMLVRESLVVYYGNEISLGAFFGSWLLWVALGSVAVVYLQDRDWVRRPVPFLRLLLLALPFVLAAQVIATRVGRLFLDVSSTQFVPLGELLSSTLLITLPTSLAVGLAFPLTCRALGNLTPGPDVNGGPPEATHSTVRQVAGLYVFEALGALLGGMLFTFVLLEWLRVWASLGLIALGLAAAAASLPGTETRSRRSALAVGLLGLAVAATPLGTLLEQRMEALRFAVLQPGLTLLDSVDTRYGHVEVARLGRQISVVNDGRIAASFPDPTRVQQDAAYFYAQANGAKRILLFGGVEDGLAAELLRYPVTRVEVVEEDRRAFEHIRPYLAPEVRRALTDPRLVVHFEDGRRFANRLPAKPVYDLVLVLAGDPVSARSNRYYTEEFYRRMRRSMTPGGVLCTSVSSASNYLGRDVKSYSGSVFRTLGAIFPHLAIAPGDQHVYCAAQTTGRVSEDPGVLESRYLATPLDEYRFPPVSFYSLLPEERVRFVHRQLEQEGGELNTDARPVTYYLNMLLWGKFSGSGVVAGLEVLRRMGPWPYLVPLVVMSLLLLLRGAMAGAPAARRRSHAATLGLAVLGFIAMAAQLALIFSYQAHVGSVFGRIALLNGIFMTGLALGAGAPGRRLAAARRPGLALAAVIALVALALAGLPTLLRAMSSLDGPQQEAVYLILCAAAGLLTGMGFPVGVGLAHTDTPNVLRSSAVIAGADNLGGALGGLITGALLVPILGVTGTAHLLALAAAVVLVPVLHAEASSAPMPALAVRSHQAFPYPLLSWGLTFLVLCALGLSLLARGVAPGPAVHFSDATLGRNSGSQRFTLHEQPIPYYLGWDGPAPAQPARKGNATPADTVSLATAPVAGDVRGHAGPVNLLVSVDRKGVLRGVQYLQSHETPSYITGIDAWLDGLAGRNLAGSALSLQDVDAMSGATITSRAVLKSINRAARAGGQTAFGKTFAPAHGDQESAAGNAWTRPKLLLLLAMLLAFFPVYRRGRDGLRLAYQAATLLVLGVGFNTLVTEVDLVNLSLGRLPSWDSNPEWYLLMGFVAVTGLLFGQAYCGYVCPFGALQEFVSRVGRLLYLRSYAVRGLDLRLRYLKYVLLALVLVASWTTGDLLWASFNPMQHVFHGDLMSWVGLLTVASLVGCLFYYRFWCRYFCPFGAFLALSNKLALLKRLGPTRRYERCDLGVHDEYDVDCLHCHRCVTGLDYGVRVRSRRTRHS